MFTKETAITLVKSADEFPVNFEDAWQWLEYSTKGNAKVSFMGSGFIQGTDYQLMVNHKLRPQGGYSNREDIYLTNDCFVHWAMMSGTPKGKEIRVYFIEAEKELKQLKQDIIEQAQVIEQHEEPMQLPSELELLKEGLKLMEMVNSIGCIDADNKRVLVSAITNVVKPKEVVVEVKKPTLLPTQTQPQNIIRRTVRDRAVDLGYTLSHSQNISAGLYASKAYMVKYGVRPADVRAMINNRLGFVKVYDPKDFDIVDAAIKQAINI